MCKIAPLGRVEAGHPERAPTVLAEPDERKAARVMEAMVTMAKIDAGAGLRGS